MNALKEMSKPDMRIEVLQIRLVNSNKTTKAYADVQIGDVLVRDFRVMKSDGQRPHVKTPFTTYKDISGQLVFRDIVSLPDEMRGRIYTAILSTYYQRVKEKQNGKPSQ